MDQPGPFQLTIGGNAFSIVGAGTFIGDVATGFAGIQACTFEAQFVFGAGSGTVLAYIQTSIDQGQTWADVAAWQFTAASLAELVNLTSMLAAAVSPITQQGLTPGQVNNVLGDRFRAVVVVSGAYSSGTILNLTGMAR
jgi:hypothetical protein